MLTNEDWWNVIPKPRGMRSIQNDSWDVPGAIAELVDNSLGPQRGDAANVWITWDVKRRLLTIVDDGRGMDAIGRLFQQGQTIGTRFDDIGKYGQGGTRAIIWLSDHLTVTTLREGKVQFDSVVWEDWFEADTYESLKVSNKWMPPNTDNCPEVLLRNGHGTLIELHIGRATSDGVKRRISPELIIKRLGELYAPGIRKGKQLWWTTIGESPLMIPEPTSDSKPTHSEEFDISLVGAKDEALPVHVRVSYDSMHGTVAKSKIDIGFGYRVIESTRDCFSCGKESYAGTGISGYADLGDGWQEYLTSTKDGVADDQLKDELSDHIFHRIRPWLISAEKHSDRLEFNGLALNLQLALNGKASMTANGHRPPHLHDPNLHNPRKHKTPRTDIEPDEAGPAQPTKGCTSLSITPANSEVMGGVLCVVDIVRKSNITARIDEGHKPFYEEFGRGKARVEAIVIFELAAELALGRNLHLLPKTWVQELSVLGPRDQRQHLVKLLTDALRPVDVEQSKDSQVSSNVSAQET